MDTKPLEQRYNNDIPVDVQKYVDEIKQLAEKPGVIAVKLLANFGKDVEMSLTSNTTVLRGMVVQLSGTYKLTNDDRLWLHPELCKGRSVYSGGIAQNSPVDLSSCNSSVGYYSSHSIDEIGGYSTQSNVVVDSGLDKVAEILSNSWFISNASVKEAYDEVVRSKLVQKSQQKRNEIAQEYGTSKMESNSNYNMLYSDGTSYYFYNHAIKPLNGEAVLNISPLMGVTKLRGLQENYVESDLISSDQYVNVSTLTESQRQRALVSCKWDGKNIVNTFTLRKPIDNYKQYLENKKSTVYRMEKGYFSSNAIHDQLPADIVLFLTPEKHLIPTGANCHQHIRDGVIDVPANIENINKVMAAHWKTLISKKYIKGDSLLLPRNMVEQSLV